MRTWKQLKTSKQKAKRLWHSIGDYLKYRVWRGISNVFYWIRTHTKDRYHIINLKEHAGDEYSWGWIDRDHAMFLACFHLLCDFVECEAGENYGVNESVDDYKGDREWYDDFERQMIENQVALHKEVRSLYDWWKVERPLQKKKIENIPLEFDGIRLETKYAENWELYKKLQDEFEEKDEEMLMRLMKVRQCLWT